MFKNSTVTPFGEFIQTDFRSAFMGNRGKILNKNEELKSKHWAQEYWITCTLHPKFPSDGQVNYTKLFFLDEATAFAAGHRPCKQCRPSDFKRFVECWANGNGYSEKILVGEIDSRLHYDRYTRYKEGNIYRSALGNLPDGVLVELDDMPETAWLLWNGELLRWQTNGYGKRLKLIPDDEVRVITPESTVKAIMAGYTPHVHHNKHW